MATRPWRSLLAASLLTLAASACGIFVVEGDDCELRPIDASPAALDFGPQRVAASCAALAEVDGRTYAIGVGRWLDEGALVLVEYAPITRANDHVVEPIAYALQGVDPTQFLVFRGDGRTDDLGETGPYMVLWGDTRFAPESVCQYADPSDIQYPAETCPLRTGRTYTVQVDWGCGLDAPLGPYGGVYWRVIDPPDAPPSGQPYPGMYLGANPGTFELLDANRAVFRSERGGELQLQRIVIDAPTSPLPCPSQSF